MVLVRVIVIVWINTPVGNVVTGDQVENTIISTVKPRSTDLG